MANIGKRILSVFVDNGDEQPNYRAEETANTAAAAASLPNQPPLAGSAGDGPGDQRFTAHFDKLFTDANIPGPDYYEFARMIVAMQVIPDERSRYVAAFAGLQAQGLDKDKLLSTAGEYLRVLGEDAGSFQKTVDSALQEKVQNRSAEAEEKNRRIQELSQQILELQKQIGTMQKDIRENQEKLEGSRTAYTAECERRRQQIEKDIEKINHYLS
ncbi:MAG TPA: hypothetical protein VGQ51_14560 [Puia sp.]|jgi:Tfp pilus assembly protein FimV|nr:hypothetical protein [Puia sp.]